MNVLVYFLATVVCFGVAYRFYGRFIARSVGEQPDRPTPAVTMNDGRDYVPTRPSVLFAHHFSTIAGAGPIVGPTLGILYGVAPTWLWVVLGAILIGGVHDLVTLFASVRERGYSIAEIARKAFGPTGFLLFIAFTIILIILVTSAFLSLTTISLTSTMPLSDFGLDASQTLLRTREIDGVVHGVIGGIASTSVIVITMVAPLLGLFVIQRGRSTLLAYILCTVIGFASVWIGFRVPVSIDPSIWMVIISVYTLFASVVPVWLILQPRDFVNVQILYAGIIALALGVVITGFQGLSMQFPATSVAIGTQKMGPLWPFLFITIACGAISGFHALVSGGTSSKQISRESQARLVGYGAMLLEGLLAVLVMIAIGSCLSYPDYLRIVWPDRGVGNPILAFALSAGNLFHQAFGMSLALGAVLGILMVEGFLITTLDTAVRLNRYLFQELWKTIFSRPPAFMLKFWFNSGMSVVLMLALAWNQGYLLIWPLFGSTNQLLAALALMTATVWLHRAGRRSWYTLFPALLMMATTIAALSYKLVVDYLPNQNFVLAATDALLLALSVGVLVLAVKELVLARVRPQVSGVS